jgi:hypothetical protein
MVSAHRVLGRSFGRRRWHRRRGALWVVLILAAWRFLKPPRRKDQAQPPRSEENRAENPETAFETTDWSVRPVALVFISTLVLIIISVFVLIAAYPTAMLDAERTLHISPPGPRLQTDPAADLRLLRAAEEYRLKSYYWISKQDGVVNIPIEEAMKKLVRTGVPGFPKAQ